MFKNLRTSTKLLLLCGTFVISIAVTTAALVAEKQIAIAFARKELVGSRYLAAIHDIYPQYWFSELILHSPARGQLPMKF